MLDLDKKYLIAAAVLIMVLVFSGGIKYAQYRDQPPQEPMVLEDSLPVADSQPEEVIQVYVIGAVANPGVYKLPPDARILEAVEMARALPEADLEKINLAQKMEDGEAVLVPRQGEETAPTALGTTMTGLVGVWAAASTGKVNINNASVQELDDRLPGIGPALAQRIIDYRTLHGRFSRVEELKEVSGIGDKKYAELQDLVTVR